MASALPGVGRVTAYMVDPAASRSARTTDQALAELVGFLPAESPENLGAPISRGRACTADPELGGGDNSRVIRNTFGTFTPIAHYG
jgi:hypothetical protein